MNCVWFRQLWSIFYLHSNLNFILFVRWTGLASHLPRPKDLVKYAESCMYSPGYRSYRWELLNHVVCTTQSSVESFFIGTDLFYYLLDCGIRHLHTSLNSSTCSKVGFEKLLILWKIWLVLRRIIHIHIHIPIYAELSINFASTWASCLGLFTLYHAGWGRGNNPMMGDKEDHKKMMGDKRSKKRINSIGGLHPNQLLFNFF